MTQGRHLGSKRFLIAGTIQNLQHPALTASIAQAEILITEAHQSLRTNLETIEIPS
jgi:hypothetical protein